MDTFDYAAPAELFSSIAVSGRSSVKYHRFATAAEAVRFAIEDLPAARFVGAVLEVDEERFNRHQIRELYAGRPLS